MVLPSSLLFLFLLHLADIELAISFFTLAFEAASFAFEREINWLRTELALHWSLIWFRPILDRLYEAGMVFKDLFSISRIVFGFVFSLRSMEWACILYSTPSFFVLHWTPSY
jgi:hypothetical protein